jgi:hypothetical protein
VRATTAFHDGRFPRWQELVQQLVSRRCGLDLFEFAALLAGISRRRIARIRTITRPATRSHGKSGAIDPAAAATAASAVFTVMASGSTQAVCSTCTGEVGALPPPRYAKLPLSELLADVQQASAVLRETLAFMVQHRLLEESHRAREARTHAKALQSAERCLRDHR